MPIMKSDSEMKGDLTMGILDLFFNDSSTSGAARHPDSYYKDDGRPCRDKILQVLAEEFPRYTVYEDISPRDLGGEGNFMNYSIAVCEGNVIRLVIMIIGKTTTSHREYRWSREFAESHQIIFLNFIRHYPNSVQYISDRLHQYL